MLICRNSACQHGARILRDNLILPEVLESITKFVMTFYNGKNSFGPYLEQYPQLQSKELEVMNMKMRGISTALLVGSFPSLGLMALLWLQSEYSDCPVEKVHLFGFHWEFPGNTCHKSVEEKVQILEMERKGLVKIWPR